MLFLLTFGKTEPPFYYKDGSIDDLLLTGISPPEVSRSYSTVAILDYNVCLNITILFTTDDVPFILCKIIKLYLLSAD